nr:FkbM family methyltransferase [uncultured Methanobacterium sp.]
MKFDIIPFKPQIGKLLKIILPDSLVVRIPQGILKNKKWIVGSSNLECALGSFEFEKQVLFEKTINESDIIYDIGANVGFYTLLSSVIVGNTGKVIAFEPVPRNINYLKKHLKINNCHNVEVMELAVSNKEGISNFKVEKDSFSAGKLSDSGNLTIKTIALDDLLLEKKISPPDVLKIDVEGSEMLVFEGAKNLITEYAPKIFLATHNKSVHEECINFLWENNYHINFINNSKNEIFAHIK